MRHKIDSLFDMQSRKVATTFDTRSEETYIDDTPRRRRSASSIQVSSDLVSKVVATFTHLEATKSGQKMPRESQKTMQGFNVDSASSRAVEMSHVTLPFSNQ